ncbi:MAG TPA: hypothetical protein VKE74_12380 [Gemmataceae bacterium]|nr:hypothetical protein [Gemmataceae bacterium]
MLPRLDGYDWRAFTEQEERAAEVPELLRRILLGSRIPRQTVDDFWIMLSGDGYINSTGLLNTIAVALIESFADLTPRARRRAAKLLNYVAWDLWLNNYGEPDDEMVRVVKDRASAVSKLFADGDPVTARLAARLFCTLRLRSARGMGRLMALYGRETNPWVRVKLVGFLDHLGGRAALPFLLDEVFVNDPEPAVRWRAARSVVKYDRRDTPADVAEFLGRVLLDPAEGTAIKAVSPFLDDGLFRQHTFTAVGRLAPEVAAPPLLTLLRRKQETWSAVQGLLRISQPWGDTWGKPWPLSPLQREILAAIVDLPDDRPGQIRMTCCSPLAEVGLPTTRQGLLDLLAGKPEAPAAR